MSQFVTVRRSTLRSAIELNRPRMLLGWRRHESQCRTSPQRPANRYSARTPQCQRGGFKASLRAAIPVQPGAHETKAAGMPRLLNGRFITPVERSHLRLAADLFPLLALETRRGGIAAGGVKAVESPVLSKVEQTRDNPVNGVSRNVFAPSMSLPSWLVGCQPLE